MIFVDYYAILPLILHPISNCCVLFASQLATEMVLAIAIVSHLLCLQGMSGSFKYFPKNSLLQFCSDIKSAVHVPFAGWLILSCSARSFTHDLIRVFCCRRPWPYCGTISHIVACVCSLLCHRLYIIFCIVAWVCWFVTKPPSASLHVFATHSQLRLIVLHTSRYYWISNTNLDLLRSLHCGPGIVWSTWGLLDSSIAITSCLPSDPN